MRIIINLDEIKDWLSESFPYRIKSRGLSIYKSGDITKVLHNIKEGSYNFDIKGSKLYHVSIQYEDGNIVGMDCTCPYRDECKHEAAALYHLQEACKAEIKKRPKSKKIVMNTSEYRPVFEWSSRSKRIDLGKLKPRKGLDFFNCDIEFTLVEGDYLVAKIIKDEHYVNYNYYGDFIDFSKWVEIKIEDEWVKSRCMYCDERLSSLCAHQHFILEEYIASYGRAITPNLFSYDSAINIFSKHLEKPIELVARMYNVFLGNESLMIGKKHLGYMDNAEIASQLISNWNDVLSVEPHEQNKNFLLATGGRKKENWQNGLVWIFDMTDMSHMPYLIKGKANKAGSKLISRFEWVEHANYANEDQSLFFNELLQINDGHEQPPLKVQLGKTLAVIAQYQDMLNNVQHMFFRSTFRSLPYDYGDTFSKRDLRKMTFSSDRAHLNVAFEREDSLIRQKVFLLLGDHKLDITAEDTDEELHMNGLMVVYRDVAYPFIDASNAVIANMMFRTEQAIFDESSNQGLQDLIKMMRASVGVTYPDDIFEKEITMKPGKKQIYLSEVGQFVLFTPYIAYQKGIKYNVIRKQFEGEAVTSGDLRTPNTAQTKEFVDWLSNVHPSFDMIYHALDYFYLNIEDIVKDGWFFEFFESCQQEGIEVFGQDNLTNFKYSPYKADIQTRISSGIDWFDVDVTIKFGEQTAALRDWVEAVKKGQKFVKLGNGTLGVLPEKWVEELKQLAQIGDIKKDKMQLSKLHFNVIDQMFSEIADEDVIKEIHKKKKKLDSFESIKSYPVPSTVTATLRPYQEQGYQWLNFLDEFEFGGCLADDMGLGKTLQVISLLMHRIKAKKTSKHLVVVPRSLLFNWEDELAKFAPSAKYLIHHGSDRTTKKSGFNKLNIIITTYGTATNDVELLRSMKFDYIILDESQAIKNPTSKRYKAMRLLKSKNRIAMTGTPIENNTFDLYAQFSFLNPGIFGGQKKFKEQFSDPIDGANDEQARNLLASLIHPFLLRRTKEQVATELPDKTESILYCEMTPTQRKYYDALRLDIKMGLKSKIEKDGLNKSKFMILDGLLKLRQVCNSPQLVDKSLSAKGSMSSKIDLLLDQIENNLRDHSALVFSQFVTMLTLIRTELDNRGIKYAYLDGSTRNRKQAVADFNDHDDCKVFLISIKAGNTGLNLVKADYVYIVDPWWNPAVEAQAIDRTHRIGQDKKVMAYRLICKDSIEEKILELQSRKKKLASDIIKTDENVFKSLEKSDLMTLFD